MFLPEIFCFVFTILIFIEAANRYTAQAEEGSWSVNNPAIDITILLMKVLIVTLLGQFFILLFLLGYFQRFAIIGPIFYSF